MTKKKIMWKTYVKKKENKKQRKKRKKKPEYKSYTTV